MNFLISLIYVIITRDISFLPLSSAFTFTPTYLMKCIPILAADFNILIDFCALGTALLA